MKKIQEGSYAEQYEETFFWLADSMISNECFLCNDPNIGLSINEVRTYVKCYMGDTGLLVSHAFDENELLEDEVYKQILSGRLSMNEGMLYENVIAQMLTANGHKLYFYTHYNDEKHRNDIEIDFLLSNNSKLKYKIYPVEVKTGAKYTTTSLTKFKEKVQEQNWRMLYYSSKKSDCKGWHCVYPAIYGNVALKNQNRNNQTEAVKNILE